MDWQVPLIISALLFGAFLVWRVRPAFGSGRAGGAKAALLQSAKRRIEEATDDVTRAAALCDAGDACAALLGRTTGAVGYYLRAMRANPSSAELVDRAANGLSRRPHALEHLLWRRLGAEPWEGPNHAAAVAALRHLSALYDGPLHDRSRARALEHALLSIGESVQRSEATPATEAPAGS